MRSRLVLVLITAIDVLLVVSFVVAARHGPVLGLGLLALVAWTIALARGLRGERTWAVLGALITFAVMALVALVLSVGVLRRIDEIQGTAPPRVHLVAPALVTIFAGAITVLVSRSAREAAERDV